MYVGRVTGTIVATIKNDLFEGRKLLIVDKLGLPDLRTVAAGGREPPRPAARYDIAVDVVQAGVGDLVLVLDEGNSARQILGREPNGAIRAVVVGVVDDVVLAE